MEKRQLDASDAMNLVLHQSQRSKIKLSREQRQIIEPCIEDVVTYGTMSEEWWRAQLGLKARKNSGEDYWVWSDEYRMYYHVNEDGSYEWSQGGESSAQ